MTVVEETRTVEQPTEDALTRVRDEIAAAEAERKDLTEAQTAAEAEKERLGELDAQAALGERSLDEVEAARAEVASRLEDIAERLERNEALVKALRARGADLSEALAAEPVRELLAADRALAQRERELEEALEDVRRRRGELEKPLALARHELSRARREFEPLDPVRALYERQDERQTVVFYAQHMSRIDEAPLHLHDAIRAEHARRVQWAHEYNERQKDAAAATWRELGVEPPQPVDPVRPTRVGGVDDGEWVERVAL